MNEKSDPFIEVLFVRKLLLGLGIVPTIQILS